MNSNMFQSLNNYSSTRQNATSSSPSRRTQFDSFDLKSVRTKAQWKYEDLPQTSSQNLFSSTSNRPQSTLFETQRQKLNTQDMSDVHSFKLQNKQHSNILGGQHHYGDPSTPSKMFQLKDKISTIGGQQSRQQPVSDFGGSKNSEIQQWSSDFNKAYEKKEKQSDLNFNFKNDYKNDFKGELKLSKRDTQKRFNIKWKKEVYISYNRKQMNDVVSYDFLVDFARKLDSCNEQEVHKLTSTQIIEQNLGYQLCKRTNKTRKCNLINFKRSSKSFSKSMIRRKIINNNYQIISSLISLIKAILIASHQIIILMKMYKLFTLIYSLITIKAQSLTANSNIKTNSLVVHGDLTCQNIYAYQTILENDLQTGQLIADNTSIHHLFVGDIVSLADESDKLNQKLIMESEVVLQSGIIRSTQLITPNFKELVQKESEWILVHHDDFETGNSLIGWNIPERSYCDIKEGIVQTENENKDYFLHTKCATDKQQELIKKYKITPSHMHIKISAELNVFGDWGGESVIMQIDNKTVWTRQFYSEEEIHHPCPKLVALSVGIESIVEHKEQEIEVKFISSDRKHPCDGSFAIDDLIISFK